jgi:hypothetical protein
MVLDGALDGTGWYCPFLLMTLMVPGWMELDVLADDGVVL